MEVGPLSCEAKFESLSISLQYGIRFSQPPLPTSLSAYLTVRSPDFPGEIRAYHVPIEYLRGLEPAEVSRLSADGATTVTGEQKVPTPDHLPFGPSLSAPLACSL